MKKIIISTLILMSSLAIADEGKFYAGPEAGISMSTKAGANYANKKLGNSASFGVFAGYEIAPNAAIELNLSRKGNFHYKNTVPAEMGGTRAYSQKFTITTLTANGLYFIDAFGSNSVKPFVSAGIGIARVKPQTFAGTLTSGANTVSTETSIATKSKNNFAYNLGAGVEFRLETVALRLSYRFSDFGKISTNTATVVANPVKATRTAKLRAHEFLFGVKVAF